MTSPLFPDLNGGLILVILALVTGVVFGALACSLLIRRKIRGEYQLIYERWLQESEKKIRQDALGKSRAVLKGKIGEQLAPHLPEFKYNPADARFIGSPIDYVIFDGYSEAMDGNGNVKKIVFMDVKTGKAKLTRTEEKIKMAVDSGRIEWVTLVLKDRV